MRRGPRRHHNPNGHIQPLTTSTVEKLLYGAPLPDIHTQRRLEEARKQAHIELAKEKDMPDIKTALETALKKSITEWDDDKKPEPQQPKEQHTVQEPERVFFNVTNNVSRATFDYVRNNPGKPVAHIVAALEAQGYKPSSTTSLLSQMRRVGTLGQTPDGCYIALSDTYRTPSQAKLKALAQINKKARKKPDTKAVKAVKAVKPVQVDAAPDPVPTPAVVAAPVAKPVQLVRMTTAEEILNTLPIKQARELYDALHTIFGARA